METVLVCGTFFGVREFPCQDVSDASVRMAEEYENVRNAAGDNVVDEEFFYGDHGNITTGDSVWWWKIRKAG